MVDDSTAGRGILPGENRDGPTSMTNVNGTLYFVASYQNDGRRLWRVSPTGSAEVVDDVIPGKGYAFPESLTVVGDTLYFFSSVGGLWRINSKGLAEGVSCYMGNLDQGWNDLTVSNGTLYFIAGRYRQVWKVDQFGVIVPVEAIVGGTPFRYDFSGQANLVDVDGELFLTADIVGSGAGRELWSIQKAQSASPVIGAFDTLLTCTENAVPAVLDANATVTDVDSANFAGGKLSVWISANGQSTDRLGIRHVGNAAGQISVSGTTVRFGGVSIGTFTGTTGLLVTLNGSATPAAVQALLRNITFASLSENPSVLNRTVKVMLTDGDGGTSNLPTKTISVVARNDAPVIGAFDTLVTYIENGVPVTLDANATVTDVDSANFAGGKLSVWISANGQSTDRLGIRHMGNAAGQIGVSGTTVRFGGVSIGTFTGTTSFLVTLNGSATPAAVQALLRNITFTSLSENPSVLNRTVKVMLTDGDGGTSNLSAKTVRVVARNDAPETRFTSVDHAFSMSLLADELLLM